MEIAPNRGCLQSAWTDLKLHIQNGVEFQWVSPHEASDLGTTEGGDRRRGGPCCPSKARLTA